MSIDMRTVSSIAIVGGGSSGWMAATYLSKLLVGVDITLVESPSIPVIGVGEATIPFIRSYMNRIGLPNDRIWMPECDATFKTGILFENWYEKGDQYWHPLFEDLDYLDMHTHTGHCWLYLHNQGSPKFPDKRSFYESFFCTTIVNAINNKIPASREYAYHFDVHLFVELLRNITSHVRHITDNIVGVQFSEDGNIDVLYTEKSGELKADLYIDCTGFKRYLIGKLAPGQKFIPYSNSLFCDRAVVLRMPYNSDSEKIEYMYPFVKASAQSSGWIWTIPLYRRISSGYVYSSTFISDEHAELELRRYWGERRTNGLESLKIQFVTGKLEYLWVKNCVAIGLAGGFIEPLESTGLAITQLGIEMLGSMLDARYYDGKMVERYNGYLDKFYDDIVQFIIAHYALTTREDTSFWAAVKHDTIIPEDLRLRLDIFRRFLPTPGTKGTAEPWMFRDLSWFSVLLGMNFNFDTPNIDRSMLDTVDLVVANKRKMISDLMGRLMNHYQYLKEEIYKD
jgi:Tryptophan halogenase